MDSTSTSTPEKKGGWVLPLVVLLIVLVGGVLAFRSGKISSLFGQGEGTTPPQETTGLTGETATSSLDASVGTSTPLPDVPAGILSRPVPASASQQLRTDIERVQKELRENANYLDNWLQLGVGFKTAEDYEGARIAWEYASLLRPKNSSSFMNLGDLYQFYLHDYPSAEKNFRRAIQNGSPSAEGYVRLFHLYELSYRQETTLAVDTLKEGMVKNPNEISLPMELARYYSSKQDKANAKLYFEKALVLAREQKNAATEEEIQLALKSL